MENYYKISFNDCVIKESDPKRLLGIMLELFDDLKLRSYENLKELNRGVLEVLKEYCEKNKLLFSGSKKAQLSRFLKWIDNSLKYTLRNKKDMLKRLYDLMLYSDGLSTLNGFGFSNNLKDKIAGNSEKQRITKDGNIKYY